MLPRFARPRLANPKHRCYAATVSPSPRQPADSAAVDQPELVGRRLTVAVERVGKVPQVRLSPEQGGGSVAAVFGALPAGAAPGDPVEVFLMTDSVGALQASLTVPHLVAGEVKFLEVTTETDHGVFVDWGLPKELLVPRKEQLVRMRVGQSYPIALTTDRQGRLMGTAHVAELLHKEPHEFVTGQWVTGEAWRNDPNIGLFAIVEGRWVGLVPKDEPHRQHRGQASKYRINQVLEDGKLELSLRGSGAEELPNDVELVLDTLTQNPTLRVGDDSTPDQIREVFGISKKAFKRVLGVLLKRGQIEFDPKGCARVVRRDA